MSNFNNTLFVGKVLIELNKTDSTNKYAINLSSKSNPSDGTVISAWFQTAGKGQNGSSWQSEAGKNLTFSIIFHPKFLPANQQFKLSQTISLGVSDFLNEYTSQVKVKWPNDIYVGDEKICGILIQNNLSGANIHSSIVGIGININQSTFEENLPNPTSLAIKTGNQFDLEKMLAELCEKIETRYIQLRAGNHALIQKDYLHHLFRFQETALYQYPDGEIFSGKIVGVSDAGKLKIHHQKGEELFDMKEVNFIF